MRGQPERDPNETEEFVAIRVFPSLLEARQSGANKCEIFVEDEQLRAKRASAILAKEKRRGAIARHRQVLSGFRPTTELTCLADLREQIKRRNTKVKASRKKAEDIRSAAFVHQQGTPFRPCNPIEARETLAAPLGGLAKNPYGRDISFPSGTNNYDPAAGPGTDVLRPSRPSSGQPRRWLPPSSRVTERKDVFLNAPDSESALRDRKRIERLRSRMLVEFMDKLMVRNASERTNTLIGYLARVEARMIRDQQARALEQARARAEANSIKAGLRRNYRSRHDERTEVQ